MTVYDVEWPFAPYKAQQLEETSKVRCWRHLATDFQREKVNSIPLFAHEPLERLIAPTGRVGHGHPMALRSQSFA
jgi:hypothetical protein